MASFTETDKPATPTSPSGPTAAKPSEHSEVAIEEFGIDALGSNGLRTKEPVRVYVRYRAREDLQIRWGFCIITSDLHTTIACDGILDGFMVSAGTNEVACNIARLPLAPGRYALRVVIMDPYTELPFAQRGFFDAPCFFEVDFPPGLRNNAMRQLKELVVLDDLTFERSELGEKEKSGEPN